MISFSEARVMWAKIGILSFGGPAGQIALMHRELVDKRKLIDENEFLGALNFCMLLPGPEAMQLATYVGWKLHGLKGGLVAGLLFILPGAIVLYALSTIYVLFGSTPLVANLFWGVKAAVLAVVLEALLRVAKRSLKGPIDYAIAGFAFIALFAFVIPFPLIIAAAAFIGWIKSQPPKAKTTAVPLPPFWQTLKTLVVWLALWLAPWGALNLFWPQSVYTLLGNFFSKLSVVTFGGAYAVLSYMGQNVVETHHWLTTPQMIDGLGLAETTPGPLILVGQFVGFLAASGQGGGLLAGFIGGAVFLWMTFVPCFLWIFAGAPYLEYLVSQPRIASALGRVTAAVCGVILNLTVWFALHFWFSQVERLQGPVPIWVPIWHYLDVAAAALSTFAAIVLLRFHWGLAKTLAFCATLGIIWRTIVVLP